MELGHALWVGGGREGERERETETIEDVVESSCKQREMKLSPGHCKLPIPQVCTFMRDNKSSQSRPPLPQDICLSNDRFYFIYLFVNWGSNYLIAYR